MSTTRTIQDSLTLEQRYAQKCAELDAMIAAERNEEIRLLEQEIEELAQLMQDLNALAMSQRPLVDTIEDNIDKASRNTGAGVEQLHEAGKLQQKRRKRTAGFIIAAVVVGVALGGGALVGTALGFTGVAALLVGASIVLAGMAVLAGITYGIYSLFKCCFGKRDNNSKLDAKPSIDKSNHRKKGPATDCINVLERASSNKRNISEEATSLQKGERTLEWFVDNQRGSTDSVRADDYSPILGRPHG